jgi:cytochrome c oxidase assembly factor CtaG
VFVLAIAAVYVRGWLRRRDTSRLAAFLGGLAALLIALESPLDALDGIFLSAHMTQHLILMMVAPPLLLMGHPWVPLLHGLPKPLVKEGLGPLLTSKPLRQLAHWLTAMPTTWLIFALSTIIWHLPRFYQLALRNPMWHGFQHACFFWTGVLFWWPIIQPEPSRRRWPEWTLIPYLLFADLVNTALSAFFVFSGRVLYPSYQALHLTGLSALDDQAFAGVIMWVPGSIIYLVPTIVYAMRLLSPAANAV